MTQQASSPSSGHEVVVPNWRAKQCLIGVGLALGVATGISALVLPLTTLYDDTDVEYLAAVALTGIVFELGLIAIVYRLTIFRGATLLALGMTRRGWRISAVIAGLVASYVALYAYLALVGLLGLKDLEPSSQLPQNFFEHDIVVVIVGISVIAAAPLAEELFFRGFLFRGVANSFGVLPGAVVSGFTFSLAHLNLGAILPFTLIGIIFALSYQRTGSLLTPIAIHFVFNTVSFTLLVLVPEARR